MRSFTLLRRSLNRLASTVRIATLSGTGQSRQGWIDRGLDDDHYGRGTTHNADNLSWGKNFQRSREANAEAWTDPPEECYPQPAQASDNCGWAVDLQGTEEQSRPTSQQTQYRRDRQSWESDQNYGRFQSDREFRTQKRQYEGGPARDVDEDGSSSGGGARRGAATKSFSSRIADIPEAEELDRFDAEGGRSAGGMRMDGFEAARPFGLAACQHVMSETAPEEARFESEGGQSAMRAEFSGEAATRQLHADALQRNRTRSGRSVEDSSSHPRDGRLDTREDQLRVADRFSSDVNGSANRKYLKENQANDSARETTAAGRDETSPFHRRDGFGEHITGQRRVIPRGPDRSRQQLLSRDEIHEGRAGGAGMPFRHGDRENNVRVPHRSIEEPSTWRPKPSKSGDGWTRPTAYGGMGTSESLSLAGGEMPRGWVEHLVDLAGESEIVESHHAEPHITMRPRDLRDLHHTSHYAAGASSCEHAHSGSPDSEMRLLAEATNATCRLTSIGGLREAYGAAAAAGTAGKVDGRQE